MARTNIQIYGIYDTRAQELIGGMLHFHRHEAAAVRMFTDVAAAPNNMISQHPEDFQLIRLGYLTEDVRIEPDFTIVLDGRHFKTLQDSAAASEQPQLQLRSNR